MELVKPDIGLIFWQLISFGVVLFVLGKFAWGPILKMLQERESSISEALSAAEAAKAEMTGLKARNEAIMAEARREKDALLVEAREMRDQMISEAKAQAGIEASKMISAAKSVIESEKATAIAEIRSTLAQLSVSVAEKVLGKELGDAAKYNDYVESSIKEFKLN
jgi:F-type H+-transporting ATPase subunit b